MAKVKGISLSNIPRANSVFNSAAVPFGDGFAGVFRCDSKSVSMDIFAGFSRDGIHWEINLEPIHFLVWETKTVFGKKRVMMLSGKLIQGGRSGWLFEFYFNSFGRRVTSS